MNRSLVVLSVLAATFAGAVPPIFAGPATADDAEVVSTDFPDTLGTGEGATGHVTVKNTGSATWTADVFKLGALGDHDDFASTRIYLPAGTQVAPGATFTFPIPLTAPGTAGTYVTSWRMVHELVRWFGATGTKTITVTPPTEDAAQLVAATLPSALSAGQTFAASVTVKNTGTNTWTADTWKLGAVDDSDPLYGPDPRVYMPAGQTVAPGDSWTFTWTLTAPQGKGTFHTDWRMVHEGVRWFGPIAESDVAVTSDQVDASTLDRKLLMGYQGWFACRGDGSPVNDWVHWCDRSPSATTMTFDLWPDVSELGPDELYDTGLTRHDGAPAKLYSAANPKTVARHFRWMKDAGVDGVLLQRFSSELRDPRFLAQRDLVLQNVRAAAEQTGRVFAVEYDISGNPESSLQDDLQRDWDHLVNDLHVTDSPRFLHHKGKPLIVIWGFGLADRPGTPTQAKAIVDHFHGLGLTVELGVAGGWRDNAGTKTDPEWQTVYHMADVINPWFVGAFATILDANSFAQNRMKLDLDDCKAHGIDYMPVVFPGFSWHNLMQVRGTSSPYNAFPRQGGKFYWAQVSNAVSIGCTMIFNAMFDEVDEGTAMMKLEPTQTGAPVSPQFVTLDADGETLPSDWYLRLAGEASKMLRGESPLTNTIPISPR